MDGFPLLLDDGNEDFEVDFEEEEDCDADEDDDEYNQASDDEECKDILV